MILVKNRDIDEAESKASAALGWAVMCETLNALVGSGKVSARDVRDAMQGAIAQFRAHFATDPESRRVLRAASTLCENVMPASPQPVPRSAPHSARKQKKRQRK